MAMQSVPPSKVVFGPFELDLVSGNLTKSGRRIRLRGQPLQVLMALIETPGESVSRLQLQQRLWPGAEFGDFDQGLNAAVNKLRQALADSADHPRYIETISGEGYRFLAPVNRQSAASVFQIPGPRSLASGKQENIEQGPPASSRVRLIAVAAGALIVLAGAAHWVTRRAPLAPATRTEVVPPEGFSFQPGARQQAFALSPDGEKLAFAALDPSKEPRVFIRESDGSQRELAGSLGAFTMFWPPDAKSLVVAARGKILRLPLSGAGQLDLGDSPSYMTAGTFAGPGQLLLNTSGDSFMLPTSGGVIAPAGDYPWAQMLPGGENILYSPRNTGKGARRVIRVAPFGHPEAAHDVVTADSRAQYTESVAHPGSGYLLYVRSGNLVALPFDPRTGQSTGDAVAIVSNIYTFAPSGSADFSVSSSGTLAYENFASRSQLAWVDRHGRELERVGPADANVMSGRLSPDGKWIVAAYYDVVNGAQDLWLFETKTGAARRLAPTPELRDLVHWAPDSKEIVYLLGGRPTQITFRGLSEGEPDRPLPFSDFNFPGDWSRDRRYVLATNSGISRLASEIQSDVSVIDLERGGKKTVLLATPYHESNAAFSPNGKWLAFTSNESGNPQVYLQAFRGGDNPTLEGRRFPVAQAGAQTLCWRADGRELYYLGFDSAVYAVSVTSGTEPQFGPPERLFAINPATGAAMHAYLGFDPSPDGSRFLIPVVNAGRKEASITIVRNWEALLP